MDLDQLAGLIETAETDDAATGPIPPRAAVEALARQGREDQILLLLAAQEIHRLHSKVTRWQATGRAAARPLTDAELRLIQVRAQGTGAGGRSLPPHIAETYRAFCLWYHRAALQKEQSRMDTPSTEY